MFAWLRSVYTAFQRAFYILRAWIMYKAYRADASYRLQKVYVFNLHDSHAWDDPIHDTNDPEFSYFYKNVTCFFDPFAWEGSKWEAEVEALTGWTKFRVEIRYAWGAAKYRHVMCRGDSYVPPPATAPKPPPFTPRIIRARLVGNAAVGATDVDCTDRVVKYHGPLRAELPYVPHMWPFDDIDDNKFRFKCLRILDSVGRVTDYPMD